MQHEHGSRMRPGFLRPRGAPASVTNIELFFDLVFAYAVTDLSGGLRQAAGAGAVAQQALLFLAVWWVWICTAWVTNWLDPARTPVRLLLLGLTLAGLVMAGALPTAFAAGGPVFAGAFVVMQLGRSLFMLWALGSASPVNTRNFQRILCWMAAAAVFWLAGGLMAGGPRTACWAVAITIEYAGAWTGFYVPRLGHTQARDWDVEGGHMAERCSQFVIIALGEAVLATGAHFTATRASLATVTALLAGFATSAAMWWLYFDTGAARASARIAQSREPGALARLAFTYLHIPIVAGIVVAAVADARVLADPGAVPADAAWAILGGPALYLAGCLAFKTVIERRPPLSHLIGLALIGLLNAWGDGLPALALAVLTAGALVVAAVWETRSLRGGVRDGGKRNRTA